MKIITWNVNGIRSVFRSGFLEWLKREDPDIVCLQEIKADLDELDDRFTKVDGYWSYFNPAKKRGYSGVAVYSKIKPVSIETDLGLPRFDEEGRGLKLTFGDFVLFVFYFPHGGRMKENLPYKLEVYRHIFSILKPFSQKNIILAGDFNIAHTNLDLANAKQNENNIMFTPIERSQLDLLRDLGFVDTFRYTNPDQKAYTWWPYAFEARARDVGWRIDYIWVHEKLKYLIRKTFMRKEVAGSDHGLYGVELDFQVEQTESPIHKRSATQGKLL